MFSYLNKKHLSIFLCFILSFGIFFNDISFRRYKAYLKNNLNIVENERFEKKKIKMIKNNNLIANLIVKNKSSSINDIKKEKTMVSNIIFETREVKKLQEKNNNIDPEQINNIIKRNKELISDTVKKLNKAIKMNNLNDVDNAKDIRKPKK